MEKAKFKCILLRLTPRKHSMLARYKQRFKAFYGSTEFRWEEYLYQAARMIDKKIGEIEHGRA